MPRRRPPQPPRPSSLVALALLAALPASAQVRIEARQGPPERRGFYRLPLREGPAPGRYRPRRELSAILSAIARPPLATRPGRMGLGVWVEPPDRPAERPHLPQVLFGGDRVHTGPAGRARVELPSGAVVHLGPGSILRIAGDGPSRTRRERIRLGADRGLLLVETPYLRPLEIEVPHALMHLQFGRALLEIPGGGPLEEAGGREAVVHVARGRGTFHGRGPRRREEVRFVAGQRWRWDTGRFAFWREEPFSLPEVDAVVKGKVRPLQDGEVVATEDPEPPHVPGQRPYPRPRVPDARIVRVGGEPASGGPPATPRPSPRTEPTPTAPPTTPPEPTPAPTDPFLEDDPFGDDPFGDEDPFGDAGDFEF